MEKTPIFLSSHALQGLFEASGVVSVDSNDRKAHTTRQNYTISFKLSCRFMKSLIQIIIKTFLIPIQQHKRRKL